MKKTKKAKIKKYYITKKELTCYVGWIQGYIHGKDGDCEAQDIFAEILKVIKYEKPKK